MLLHLTSLELTPCRNIVPGAWTPKLGTKCSVWVLKRSPTYGSILADIHWEETRTGLWGPEVGLATCLPHYCSLSMIFLRTGEIFTGCLAERIIIKNKTSLQSNTYCELLLEKRNLTHRSSVIPLLLPEMLKQCQRAQKFLQLRHNFRTLYFCKHQTPCREYPFLLLSSWRIFKLSFQPQFWCHLPQEAFLTLPASVSFLDFGTIDIWGHISLCCEKYGCPAHCRMCSSIPTL